MLVGDTPLDVRAAHEAGARAVAVATGFADPEALRASGPDACFEDLSDTDAAVARDHWRHLTLQPTGSVSGRAGSSPAEHRVERLAQPARVLRLVLVVGVGRAAVARARRSASSDEHVGRRLRAVRPRHLLR